MYKVYLATIKYLAATTSVGVIGGCGLLKGTWSSSGLVDLETLLTLMSSNSKTLQKVDNGSLL